MKTAHGLTVISAVELERMRMAMFRLTEMADALADLYSGPVKVGELAERYGFDWGDRSINPVAELAVAVLKENATASVAFDSIAKAEMYEKATKSLRRQVERLSDIIGEAMGVLEGA